MHIKMPPKWFHPHGLKLALGGEPICQVTHENEVVIGSKVARLQIRPSVGQDVYQVLWYIRFFSDEFVQGQIRLLTNELKDAFGIAKSMIAGNTLAVKFGANTAFQGHYIRKGSYLNIPSPGTGSDGDPNISVYVSDEIIKAVKKLVGG